MGDAAFRAGVPHPLTRVAQRVAGRVVLLTEDVARLELQTLRQPLAQLELQRVVVGPAAVADDVGAADEVGIDLEEVCWQPGRERVAAERAVADQPVVPGVREVVGRRVVLRQVPVESGVRPVGVGRGIVVGIACGRCRQPLEMRQEDRQRRGPRRAGVC